MEKYIRFPLLFLFIASLLGVFLRLQFIVPTSGVRYAYFLHAHSHTMFLGWVFNALYIGFILAFIQQQRQRIFERIFILLQVLVVAMMISFPIQGYGTYSIIFSTLHTVLAIVFIFLFFRKTKEGRTASLWFARVALLFFVLSSLGPFSLGYLMANGLGQSQWYYFSIYYYLHFQYNGFFLFGVFSLFLHVLERKQIVYDHQLVKMIGQWLAVACVPTYLLSVLWAKPGVIYNIVGGLAGLMQLYAVALLITVLKKIPIRHQFTKPSRFLLTFAFLALVLKILLQLFSSFPIISAMAYELKPIVIAYLHLVLIGVISVMILAWYFEMNFINPSGSKILPLFLTAFIATQTGLILQPWWGNFSSIAFLTASEYLLLFSTLLSLSCFLLFYCSNARKLI